jgi:hypothetical protein
MTQEDIIRMARNEYGIYAFTAESLAEFAIIIAAAEREACAKACEELLSMVSTGDEHMDGVTDCIVAIRARGNK